jgi:hypothetical protein
VPVTEATVSTDGHTSYEYDSDAIDPDRDPIQYSLVDGPAGLQIDPATGLVTWSPTAEQIGFHPVTLEASDGRGGVADQMYVVQVLPDPGNRPPVIISEPVDRFHAPGQINPPAGATVPQRLDYEITARELVTETISIVLPDEGGGAGFADIIFVVDESGSMAGEQAWIRDVIGTIDASLQAEGIVDNRYGLVGFADTGRILQAGDTPFMSVTDFVTAASQLRTNRSGREDGYNGIHFAMNKCVFPDRRTIVRKRRA